MYDKQCYVIKEGSSVFNGPYTKSEAELVKENFQLRFPGSNYDIVMFSKSELEVFGYTVKRPAVPNS